MNTALNKIHKAILAKDYYAQRAVGYPTVCVIAGSIITMGKELGYQYTDAFYRFKDGQVEMNYRLSDFARLYGIIKEKIADDPGYLSTIEQKYYKTFESHQPTFAKVDSGQLDTASNTELFAILKDLFVALNDSVGIAHVLEAVGQNVENDLREILKTKNNADVEADLHTLSTPVHPSWLTQEENELAQISQLTGAEQEQKLLEHYEKWRWIKTNYAELGGLSVEYFKRRMGEASGEHFSTAGIQETKEALMNKLGFSETEKGIVARLDQTTTWQDNRKANIYKTFDYTYRFFDYLGERCGFKGALLKYLVSSDLAKMNSFDDLLMFIPNLQERTTGVCVYQDGDEYVFIKKDFEEIEGYYEEARKDEAAVQEIKGSVAFKGKVKGVVRVCLTLESIEQFKQDEILVASMTRPEYISAMKQAAAFVTDEGGITCHAAIVAREMKKPCIIGTKIATKVLKDGDMVEVDADKGIIRIIKNKNANLTKPEIDLIEEGIQMELWLERKNLSPLIISLFHFLEGPKMQELIGGGFSKEISVVKEGVSYWIRPANEITGLVKSHQEFISKSNIEDLKNLLDKAVNIYNAADANIIAIANSNDKQFSQLVKTFLEEVSEILLYTTTIPYFLLSALENSNLEKAKYELVHSKCEEMRGDSKYVKAQEVFIPKLVQYLKTHHSLTEEEAKDIAYDELISLLNDGEWKKDEKLSQRGHSSVFWLNFRTERHEFSYDQRVFDYFYDKYVKVDIQNSQEIIGSIANKGFAKGRVVIVNSPDELGKVEEGDIIVSRNTNPSLMPALKKCAAIVTDEGGIACHAAIVSRELNKPCITGTKIATKVLKDGDMVEVDAERGIVRLLA